MPKSYKQYVKSIRDLNVFEVFDEYTDWSILYDYIKEAPHYLIYLKGGNWRGVDCFKIVDHVSQIFYRSYVCSISMTDVSSGGKVLMCRESSHDVPMGCPLYIIALTESEYAALTRKYNRNGFEEINRFVTTELLKVK